MLLQSLLRPVLTPIMRGIFDPAQSVSAAWSPLSLWPDGISSAGMWISPRTLTSEWQDYTGTTPVVTPGTVADSANPVGLALDIRAGNPPPLGPELVVNGDFSGGATGWVLIDWTVSGGVASLNVPAGYAYIQQATTLTVGATYLLSFDITVTSGGIGLVSDGNGTTQLPLEAFTTSQHYSGRIVAVAGTVIRFRAEGYLGACVGTIDNISVKEVPGNHMTQSTSAARPLLSARVNLLTYTEDFSNAAWAKTNSTITADATTAPNGATTADLATSSGGETRVGRATGNVGANTTYTASISGKFVNANGRYLWYRDFFSAKDTAFDLQNGVVVSTPVGVTATITPEANGFYRCTVTLTEPASAVVVNQQHWVISSSPSIVSNGVAGGALYLWGAQLQLGSTASRYQPILTGSTYPSTDFPVAQLYDGVDDGMATAAFAAGTLTSGMDCMIAVRRDSAAKMVLGLYETAGGGIYFGAAESPAGAYPSCAAAGTPTIWVDGVQLAGGTAVTALTVSAAVTPGDWHIVEFRNLYLPAWVGASFGLYGPGYNFPGARGDILLYPSTASTTDKDNARQWLADYYGVTLP